MKAMIQNDADKSWMRPLLELRNDLDFRGDAQRQRELDRRDFRRLRGSPQLNRTGEDLIPGPYVQAARAEWLTKLLQAQMTIRDPFCVQQVGTVGRDNHLHMSRRVMKQIENRLQCTRMDSRLGFLDGDERRRRLLEHCCQ